MVNNILGHSRAPASLRRTHPCLALNELLTNDEVSRTGLADELGLSQMAMSRVVSDLFDAGVVQESGIEVRESGPGRRQCMLRIRPNGAYAVPSPSLAPAYDIVCTAAYPQMNKKIAMRIGDRNIPDTIQLKHWLALVPSTKASQALLIKELTNMATSIVPHAESLLKESEQQGFDHPILNDVVSIIKTRAVKISSTVA